MNERIKEIALKAGMKTTSLHYGRRDPYVLWEDNIETFAELIIRECMNCADWVGKVNQNPVEPIHTTEAVKKRIEQQLGVRE